MLYHNLSGSIGTASQILIVSDAGDCSPSELLLGGI